MTPAEDFLKFNPPSRLDFQSLLPPLPREFPESHPSGGVDFFWNNPMRKVNCEKGYWEGMRDKPKNT